MKKFTSILIMSLFCLLGVARGQELVEPKSTVRIGINRAFFGAGDIVGPGMYAEYSYSLNKYFALTPRIMSAYAYKKGQFNYDHASSFGSSLAIRITPLPNSFGRLKFDVGGLYHRFINTYGSGFELSGNGGYVSSSAINEQENLFGLLGSLNINILERKKLEGGFRFDMMTSFTEGYFNCDSWQTGLYIGFKF